MCERMTRGQWKLQPTIEFEGGVCMCLNITQRNDFRNEGQRLDGWPVTSTNE